MILQRLQLTTLLMGLAAVPALSLSAEVPQQPAKVMMMGVFHFANPGADIVKSRVIDVMAAENQAYLHGLATRLAAFHPTDVLVECNPSDQAKFNEKFAAYQKGKLRLTSNEVYQIGFRVAKDAGISTVTCFDEDKIGWEADPLFKYIKAHDPKMQASLDATYKSLSEQANREQSTLPLWQLLELDNNAVRDRENMNLYIGTNPVDAGGSFVGADATASWWHRNFRMYANVQKAAAAGHRVLVIAGQGHTAILKSLLAIDTQRQAENVVSYLHP